MDNRGEVREFLTTRRARVTPEAVGLPGGGDRRVPGLRRGEVAALAGVSVEYYARLERGNLSGASDAVLDAVATGLGLDDAERAHLFDLARTAHDAPLPRRRRRSSSTVPPLLQQTLDAITAGPAFVRNGRMDLLATNALARVLYAPASPPDGELANLARFQFLDVAAAQRFYRDWDDVASDSVASLRAEAGRDPHDRDLHDLVGELSTRSDEFRHRWAAHDVRQHATGAKTFRHPLVGELTLQYQVAGLAADPRLTLVIYSAEPGSPSETDLRLLASWAASHDIATDAAARALARGR
ncbi:helix-turn-helix transcriptional regulator [Amnibacterium sp. CER49]|uniref:helix-turn-helix transcriptional regulator n=1 Tax=Amnibacterium sp. CER49 TaxID=3039161 RepID=UPI00244BB978|nr:helix-turn-helix transcriptional regulator [Amnibacterium sp. CER49]MDH2442615.1 helix-turn-helix transcriptional regulator [Amnibacterium sp. CER49]